MSKIPKKQIHPGFQTLLEEVLPQLVNFQDDVRKYDHDILVEYQGAFISMYRDTGTDLVKVDSVLDSAGWTEKDVLRSIQLTHDTYTLIANRNQGFLYVDSLGKSKKLELADTIRQLEIKKSKAIEFYNSFKMMNFEAMATEIKFHMYSKGRTWKSSLKEEWFQDNCSSEARRLRNHFGEEVLVQFKKEMDVEEIRNILIKIYMEDK